jgi:MoxR-like ATPase
MPERNELLNTVFPNTVTLQALGPYESHDHVFDERSVWAIKAALAAERPLLVCGEPGTGKSQLARAAAQVMRRPLVSHVITSRTEPQDLLWTYDAVTRLAEAQILSIAARPVGETDGPDLSRLQPLNFVSPGPLWWVFDWDDALKQRQNASVACPQPEIPEGWLPERGVVALIDEIDKADLDLPNALLECLGNGEFHLPHRAEPVACSPGSQLPLVIITTNRERQLPPAFVRRCLVLELALPEERLELIGWLTERGTAHFGDRCPAEVRGQVASTISDLRSEGTGGDVPAPGLAEYLDLLRALASHAPGDAARQREILESIGDFVYEKRSAFEI